MSSIVLDVGMGFARPPKQVWQDGKLPFLYLIERVSQAFQCDTVVTFLSHR